jgi:hypothetical protein
VLRVLTAESVSRVLPPFSANERTAVAIFADTPAPVDLFGAPVQLLDAEIAELDDDLETLLTPLAPTLLQQQGALS